MKPFPTVLRPLARLAAGLIALATALAPALSPARDKDIPEAEGGIVGTGIAPAGIYGVITGLGSIHVNGQRVVYDPGLLVHSPLGSMTAEMLEPGDVVAVMADPEGDDWRARSIDRVFALIGPIESVARGSFTVMGSQVLADAGELEPGDWVAVSGLWQENALSASDIEPIPPQDHALVQGTWKRTPDGVTIGGARLEGISPTHAGPGEVLSAEGQPIPGGISAERLSFGIFPDSAGLVLAEGYLADARDGSGMYILLGSGLVAYTENPGMIDPEQRILSCGSPADGGTVPQELAARLGCTDIPMMDPATPR